MRKLAIALTAMLCGSGVARADNSACWGDNSREDITCVQITEPLLLSFRGQSRDFVRKAMKAPGVERHPHSLHFLSNYSKGRKTGSGDVNVTFEDGRATIVNASIDTPEQAGQFEFIWNAYAAPPLGQEFDRSTKDFARQPFCSDFSGKPQKCKGGNIERELTLSQVEFGLTKADVLRELNSSCNPGQGIVVSDPAGDCARLRDRLR